LFSLTLYYIFDQEILKLILYFMKIGDKLFGLFGAVLLSTGLYSCSNGDELNSVDQTNSVEQTNSSELKNVATNSAFEFESETMDLVENFYGGNYTIVTEEYITNEEDESFHISTIESDGIERGYIIKVLSENKVVFADKNEESKTLTYFDMSFSESLMELDYSHADDTPDDNYTTYSKPGRFLGFNFGKFFGHSKRYGDNTYEIEPGSCYRQCVDTYVVLGFEFQNGNWGPCNC